MSRNLVAVLAIAVLLVLGAVFVFDARTQEQATTEQPVAAAPTPAERAPAGQDSVQAGQPSTDTASPAREAETIAAPNGPWFDAATIAAPAPLVHYGEDSAPAVIEEYASFTCSHCASFATSVFPELEQGLIAQGDAQLALYSFIRNEPDLRATQMLSCITDESRRARFAKTLFTMQERWAFAADPVAAMKQIATFGGIDGAAFDACLANSELENALLAQQQDILGRRQIESTPTFFLGEEKLEGVRSVEEFAAAAARAR